MKRVFHYNDGLNNKKYVKQEEYNGCGIYRYMCPAGMYVHQEWAITAGDKTIICQSFNSKCKEEILDAIDEYVETGVLGFKAFKKSDNIFVIHPAGDIAV